MLEDFRANVLNSFRSLLFALKNTHVHLASWPPSLWIRH